ncbi:hypothetical protein KTT66_13135 [Lacticaseibacillus casei]|uniref:hypothetical protein n=1 Tax=Lacticaseibacillus casei TaxID=1582 RepID=UPI001C386BDB|nr:hypothetical protein [Lacticaseibacillus casei]QXG59078.1 hypothetical protein KTT66_13135 [Lacticaseibacillus casei]
MPVTRKKLMPEERVLKLIPKFSKEDIQKTVHELSDGEFRKLAEAFELEEVEPDK